MKKTLFISKKLLVALLLPLGFANAQTKPNPLPEAPEPIPKWELSVDLKPLIGQGNSDGVGYILRKYTKHNTAFRFKVNPNFKISSVYVNNPYANSYYKFYAGYEWIKKRKNNWFFYGFDISHRGQINPPPNFTDNDAIWGLEGFVGIRQKITPHIAVSLESHLGVDYHYLKIAGLDASYYSMNSIPIYGVYLNYQF